MENLLATCNELLATQTVLLSAVSTGVFVLAGLLVALIIVFVITSRG